MLLRTHNTYSLLHDRTNMKAPGIYTLSKHAHSNSPLHSYNIPLRPHSVTSVYSTHFDHLMPDAEHFHHAEETQIERLNSNGSWVRTFAGVLCGFSEFHAQNEWSEMYWFRRASKRSPRQGYGCVSKRSPQWLRRGPVKEVQRGYDNPVKEIPVVTAARVELVVFCFSQNV